MKKVIFPIFSLFLLFVSSQLVKGIFFLKAPLEYSNQIIFALLLNLYLTGVFAFIGFAYKSSLLLPSSYYQINNPKKLLRIYKKIGVKYFRRALMISFWGKSKNRKKYFNGRRSGIVNLTYQSKQSEFGHLAAMVLIFLASFSAAASKQFVLFFMINAINIIANFYPVILQRHHRLRINKIGLITN